MVEEKAMVLEACRYDDLAKHSKVFNLAAIEYHLWIYLNPEDVRDCYFLKATEIGENADNVNIYPDTFVRESQCWIRANTGYIGTETGKHTIKLWFVNRYTDVDFSLYVSYYIQNDNPEKSYVYMKQDVPVVKDSNYVLPPYTEHTC